MAKPPTQRQNTASKTASKAASTASTPRTAPSTPPRKATRPVKHGPSPLAIIFGGALMAVILIGGAAAIYKLTRPADAPAPPPPVIAHDATPPAAPEPEQPGQLFAKRP